MSSRRREFTAIASANETTSTHYARFVKRITLRCSHRFPSALRSSHPHLVRCLILLIRPHFVFVRKTHVPRTPQRIAALETGLSRHGATGREGPGVLFEFEEVGGGVGWWVSGVWGWRGGWGR
ncbi:hypothetical protein HBI56_065810 [Parastagonospora nodorum]|nr:hypothetical protein HBI56_065810 [Parastagonospora nodorum]